MRFRLQAAVTVALGALFAPARALAFGSCTQAAYVHAFDDRMTPSVCDEIQIFDLTATKKLRLEKERASTFGDPAPISARIRNFILKFDAALDQVGMRVSDTTVLMTDMSPPNRESAHTWHAEDECVIPFYKSQNALSDNAFVFTLAHELFHCVQWVTFPAQFDTYSTGGAWWVEGTAEWFAQVAMTGTTESDDFAHQFDAKASSTSIVDMVYENVVFFSWLSQHDGVPAVRSFIGSMTLNPGRLSQVRAVEGIVPKEKWMQFVEDYLDQHVKYPGGNFIPLHPQEGETHRISDASGVHFSSNPFQVEHNVLQFERGHFYSITAEDQPADSVMRWSKDGGAWVETPSGVPACDEPQRYRVAWGTTHSTDEGRIVIKPRGDGVSCGLLGRWQITPESLQRNVAAMNPHKTCNVTGGNLLLTFNPDATDNGPGSGLYTWDHIIFHCDSPPASGMGSFDRTIDGTAQTKWSVVLNSLTIAFPGVGRQIGTVHTVSQTATTTVKDEPLMWGPGLGPFLGGRFRVDHGTLHIDPPPMYQMENYSFDFIRAGGG